MLKQDLHVDATLVVGSSGIFEVDVDGQVVVQRKSLGFPSEQEIVEAVSRALRPG